MKPIRFVLFTLLILSGYACKKNLNESPLPADMLRSKSVGTWLISKYTASSNSQNHQVTYSYDANNRLRQSIKIYSGSTPSRDTLNYVFNTAGQLHYTFRNRDTSFYSYDAQGRLARRYSAPRGGLPFGLRPEHFYYYKGDSVAGVLWYEGYTNLSIAYRRTEYVYNTSGNVVLSRSWLRTGRFTLDTTLFPTTAGTPVIEEFLSYDNHTNVNRFLNIDGPEFLITNVIYGFRQSIPRFSANNLTSDSYYRYAITYNQDGLVKEIKVLYKDSGEISNTFTYEYKRAL